MPRGVWLRRERVLTPIIVRTGSNGIGGLALPRGSAPLRPDRAPQVFLALTPSSSPNVEPPGVPDGVASPALYVRRIDMLTARYC